MQLTHTRAPLAAPLIALLASTALTVVGCTTTSGKNEASATSQQQEIDAGVDATLSRLYAAAPQSRELVKRAEGVLVFPSVLSAAFMVGAQRGDGALRVGNKTAGYYTLTSGSFGIQAGAQSKSVVFLFMTPEALKQFRESSGWTAGVDATVAVADIGATGAIDTETMKAPVIGFVMSSSGLMAGVSLQGSKISKKEI